MADNGNDSSSGTKQQPVEELEVGWWVKGCWKFIVIERPGHDGPRSR